MCLTETRGVAKLVGYPICTQLPLFDSWVPLLVGVVFFLWVSHGSEEENHLIKVTEKIRRKKAPKTDEPVAHERCLLLQPLRYGFKSYYQ